MQPLPIMHRSYSEMLTAFLVDVLENHSISVGRLYWQDGFRADLERRLQETLRADTRLQLFGSSCNGFGFTRSDLDLCLTFENSLELPPVSF